VALHPPSSLLRAISVNVRPGLNAIAVPLSLKQ
jgi:hypothetical protein